MQSADYVKALLSAPSKPYDRIQRFVVADDVFEVEYEYVGDSLPPLYYVRDPRTGKSLHFSAVHEHQHYEVLLAGLDWLEEHGELPLRVAVFDPEKIVAV